MLLFSRPLFSPKGKCLKWRAWENSPHFPRSPLVFPRSDVCPGEMSAYWWRVTTQISVVLLIGWKLYGISSLVPQWDVVSRGNCRCHRQMSAVSSGCYWVTRLLLRWMLFFFCLSSQRNGADFSVFVNTGQEFDGSDSGARPDEAVSWGKIKMTATPVKVEYTHNRAIDYY